MIGTSLAMAPAMLVAQHASIVDLDAPLLLGERPGARAALRGQHALPARAGAMGLIYAPQRARRRDRGARRRAGVSARSSSAPARRAFAAGATAFATLLHIILEQQVSIDAAAAMHRRLAELCRPLAPGPFLALDDATLRRCGFSRQKMDYARRLAAAVAGGEFDFARLAAADDAAALAALVGLKGIGRWSAEIYLIFALGRADIWPAADLGLQLAVAECLGLAERARRAGVARDRRGVAAVALGGGVPVLAILSARARPRRPAARAGTLCRRGLGFRQLEELARIDPVRVADLAAIGRVNYRVSGAPAIEAAGDQPQAVAALNDIAVVRRQGVRAARLERHSDPARDAAVGGEFVEAQLDAARFLPDAAP